MPVLPATFIWASVGRAAADDLGDAVALQAGPLTRRESLDGDGLLAAARTNPSGASTVASPTVCGSVTHCSAGSAWAVARRHWSSASRA